MRVKSIIADREGKQHTRWVEDREIEPLVVVLEVNLAINTVVTDGTRAIGCCKTTRPRGGQTFHQPIHRTSSCR